MPSRLECLRGGRAALRQKPNRVGVGDETAPGSLGKLGAGGLEISARAFRDVLLGRGGDVLAPGSRSQPGRLERLRGGSRVALRQKLEGGGVGDEMAPGSLGELGAYGFELSARALRDVALGGLGDVLAPGRHREFGTGAFEISARAFRDVFLGRYWDQLAPGRHRELRAGAFEISARAFRDVFLGRYWDPLAPGRNRELGA